MTTLHYFTDEGIDWAAWITAISTAVLAAGVLVALWGIVDARRTRDGQLVTDLSRRWDEPLVHESIVAHHVHGQPGTIDLIRRLYRVGGAEPLDEEGLRLYTTLTAWPVLIDVIGVLVSEKAISLDVAYKMWGHQVVSAWDWWKEPVLFQREIEAGDSAYADFLPSYSFFEDLARQMRDHATKPGDHRWWRRKRGATD